MKPNGIVSASQSAMMAVVVRLMGVIDVPLRALQRKAGQSGMAAFFLAPNMAIFAVFVLIPFVINFIYSLTGGAAIFLDQRSFVGLQQYANIFDCGNYLDPNTCKQDVFWIAAGNTFWFVVIQVTLMIVAALVTALILNREIIGRGFWRGFWRAVFFFPVLLSPVVTGLIWRWIFQRQGVLNAVMQSMGLEPHDWLTERATSFFATIGVSVWAHVGFYTLILLAGLQAIPKDLYEAAEMDGTSRSRVFWRITLPLLMPNLVVVLVLALIRAVQIFDEAFVLTHGGPGTSTMYMVQYIYEMGFASELRNPGLAAAASILMGAVLVVLTLAQMAASRRNEKKGER